MQPPASEAGTQPPFTHVPPPIEANGSLPEQVLLDVDDPGPGIQPPLTQ